jgi:hypothetical protein
MKLYKGLEMLRLGAANPKRVRHSHQVRQGLRPHLSHDIAAMHLHGDMGMMSPMGTIMPSSEGTSHESKTHD